MLHHKRMVERTLLGHQNAYKERWVIFLMEIFKKYGKSLFITASSDTQAVIFSNSKPLDNSNIRVITYHKPFNTLKGVTYSKEICDFSEEDTLERCTPFVYQVRKSKGSNHAILLTFGSRHMPDYLVIDHVRIVLNEFRPK